MLLCNNPFEKRLIKAASFFFPNENQKCSIPMEHANILPPRYSAPVTLNDKSKLGVVYFYCILWCSNVLQHHSRFMCAYNANVMAHRNSIGFESNLFAWFSTGKVSATENINTALWLTLFYYQNCLEARTCKKKRSNKMKSVETVFGISFDCNQICLACVKKLFLNLG